jgi:hypothetical protein
LGLLFQGRKQEHVPVIECPNAVAADEVFEVRVSLGKEVAHPNTTEHHIRKPGTLFATAFCNIHGLWENSKALAQSGSQWHRKIPPKEFKFLPTQPAADPNGGRCHPPSPKWADFVGSLRLESGLCPNNIPVPPYCPFLKVIIEFSMITFFGLSAIAGVLDGKIFTGQEGLVGKKASGIDEVAFKDGKFISSGCIEWCGFHQQLKTVGYSERWGARPAGTNH